MNLAAPAGRGMTRAAFRDVPPPDGFVVPWLFAITSLVMHLLTNGGYHVFRDEFYYLACGRHLAWGYVDHPPFIAFVAAGSHALFGDSIRGLRLASALAGSATLLFTGGITRDFGGRTWAQAFACLGVLVAPVYLENFTILTMNAFDVLGWTVALFLLVRLLRGSDPWLWLVFGAVAGLGLLNKHSMLFLIAGVFVGMVLTPARAQLRTRWPWRGALVALVLFAPHLAWQAQHGAPTLEFMRNAQTYKNYPVSPREFVLAQVLIHHPFTAPLWVAGLGWLLFARGAVRWRAIGLAYLFILAVFVVTRAKAYYLSPMVPVLFAAGGVAVDNFLRTHRLGLVRPVYATLLLAGGALVAPLVLPILPPERLVAYMRAIHAPQVRSERHTAPRLTQTFADEFGWEEMVARVARVYHALPEAERARCAIFASNYGEAGAIDYYGPRYGLPHAISGHNSYWLWGPGPRPVDVVITVGEDRDDVLASFRDVTEADRTHCEWCMPYEDGVPILVGRGPRRPLAELWRFTKKYI